MDKKQLKQAQGLFKTVCKALKSEGWTYQEHEKDFVITTGARGDDLPIPVVINVNVDNGNLAIYSEMPFSIPENVRNRLAVAINIINFSISNGCFDYDYNTGRVIFRICQYYRDCEIGVEAVMHLIMIAFVTIDKYNDRLLYISKADELSLEQMVKIIDKD